MECMLRSVGWHTSSSGLCTVGLMRSKPRSSEKGAASGDSVLSMSSIMTFRRSLSPAWSATWVTKKAPSLKMNLVLCRLFSYTGSGVNMRLKYYGQSMQTSVVSFLWGAAELFDAGLQEFLAG